MKKPSRRRFLLAAGGIAGLSGCSGLPGGTSDPSEPAGGEPDTLTDSRGAKQTDSDTAVEPSLDAITVEKAYDIENNPRNMWKLVNESSSMLQMATISRLVPSEVEGVQLEEEEYVTFAVPPGGRREFQSKEDDNTNLVEGGSWFTNQNQSTGGQADTTSAPVGISEATTATATESAPTPATYDYVIQNPTEIPMEDVQEGTIDIYGLETDSDGFQYSSAAPLWNRPREIQVDGTTTSETFTWAASQPPQIDVTVEGTLGNLTLNFETQSHTPLLNPVIYVVAIGPSTSGDKRAREIYRDEELVTGAETTKALVTESIGEGHVGNERSVTLSFDTNVNFPVDDEDRLIAGVATGYRGQSFITGYPVASTEVPLVDVVE